MGGHFNRVLHWSILDKVAGNVGYMFFWGVCMCACVLQGLYLGAKFGGKGMFIFKYSTKYLYVF